MQYIELVGAIFCEFGRTRFNCIHHLKNTAFPFYLRLIRPGATFLADHFRECFCMTQHTTQCHAAVWLAGLVDEHSLKVMYSIVSNPEYGPCPNKSVIMHKVSKEKELES